MNQKKEHLEWIELAEQDLNSGIYLMNMVPKPLEIICYHCQQSAEKYLKAFLVKNEEQIVRTHDLTVLHLKCKTIDSDIDKIKKECANLTNFSVNIRYPFHIELKENDAKMAIENSKKIKRLIEYKLKTCHS